MKYSEISVTRMHYHFITINSKLMNITVDYNVTINKCKSLFYKFIICNISLASLHDWLLPYALLKQPIVAATVVPSQTLAEAGSNKLLYLSCSFKNDLTNFTRVDSLYRNTTSLYGRTQ